LISTPVVNHLDTVYHGSILYGKMFMTAWNVMRKLPGKWESCKKLQGKWENCKVSRRRFDDYNGVVFVLRELKRYMIS